MPAVRAAGQSHAGKHGEVRRGLLYMLLGAVIYYFTGGFGALSLPFTINPLVATYLAPLIFLNGLGFAAYEFYRSKSA